jgi:hypothetical protein
MATTVLWHDIVAQIEAADLCGGCVLILLAGMIAELVHEHVEAGHEAKFIDKLAAAAKFGIERLHAVQAGDAPRPGETVH